MSKNTRNTHAARRRPTLAVCVIARDEEAFIGACLDSVRPYVDELVVVDTGSTDRTVAIAREHGARVAFFEWCDDFAAARNAAIDAATADWILMLDADEELDPASVPALRQLVASPLPADTIGYSIMIDNRRRDGSEDAIRHFVTRLFPRRRDIRYVGAIHEDLLRVSAPGRSRVTFVSDVRLVHYGYDPAVYVARAKDQRNLRLLEQALEWEPDHPRILFHLGQQHRVGQRYAEAAATLERFEARADELPKHYHVDAYRMWIEALIALGDEVRLNEVVQRADLAEMLSAQSHHVLAAYELKRNRLGLALRHCLSALNPNAPIGVAAEPGVGGWRTRLLLADVHEALNDPRAALQQREQALPEVPDRRRAQLLVEIARLACLVDDPHGLAWVDRATAAAPDEFDAQAELLGLRLDRLQAGATPGDAVDGSFDAVDTALAFGDWQAAYDETLALPLGSARALVRVVAAATRLRERRAPGAALNILSRAMDAYPTSPRVYWPLVQVLTDLERFDDALLATQVLQSLG